MDDRIMQVLKAKDLYSLCQGKTPEERRELIRLYNVLRFNWTEKEDTREITNR